MVCARALWFNSFLLFYIRERVYFCLIARFRIVFARSLWQTFSYPCLLFRVLPVQAVSFAFQFHLEISCLVLIGGDTSFNILNTINFEGVMIDKEVLPGIPSVNIIGGEYDGMKVITKAGGFGNKQTLITIIELIRKDLWFYICINFFVRIMLGFFIVSSECVKETNKYLLSYY